MFVRSVGARGFMSEKMDSLKERYAQMKHKVLKVLLNLQ